MAVEPISSEWLHATIKRCPIAGFVLDTEVRDDGIAVIIYESNWNRFSLDEQVEIGMWLNRELLNARDKGMPVFIDIESVAPSA